jgi:hypothetical protein
MAGQIARGIAETVICPRARFRLIDRGPFADEAKAAGLVDRLGYRDGRSTKCIAGAGSGAELVSSARA